MPNAKVYGRRPNRFQMNTSQYFISSSPIKPVEQGTNAESNMTFYKRGEVAILPKESPETEIDDANIVVGKMAILNLSTGPSNRDQEVDIIGESRTETNILGERDANAAARPTPRKRNKAKRLRNTASTIPACVDVPTKNTPGEVGFTDKVAVEILEDNTPAESPKQRIPAVVVEELLPRARPERPRRKANQTKLTPILPSTELIAYTKPLLSLCADTDARLAPSSFQAWADSLSAYFSIAKIAEASYGEVYRLSLQTPKPGFTRGDESVLKIIALKPPPFDSSDDTGEHERTSAMSAIEDVASEVRLLQRMSPVPGWTRFRDINVLQGRLPRQFVSAWKYYNKNVKKSHFPDPARKGSHGEEQLWAVVEMQDAGTDLETLIEKGDECMKVVSTVWDIFWGVACTVAKGEEWAKFEHRDLHLGNICVTARQSKTNHRETKKIPSTKRKLGLTNLESTIIDYTLSRASLSGSTDDAAEEQVAFFDLSKDPAIFAGNGADDYQYDIYRYMRSAAICGDPAFVEKTIKPKVKKPRPQRRNVVTKFTDDGQDITSPQFNEPVKCNQQDDVWRQHHAITNLVWLHFVLHTLLTHLTSSSMNTPTSSSSQTASESPLTFSPPISVSTTPDNLHLYSPPSNLTALEESTLHARLTLLNQKLAIQQFKKCGLTSAADLVAWAVEEGWLDEADVIGDDGCDDGEFEEVANVDDGVGKAVDDDDSFTPRESEESRATLSREKEESAERTEEVTLAIREADTCAVVKTETGALATPRRRRQRGKRAPKGRAGKGETGEVQAEV